MSNEDFEYESVSADRLVEAAEAILLALAEVSDLCPDHHLQPTELLGSELQPKVLCDFTREEIVEADAFLRRMGMLPEA